MWIIIKCIIPATKNYPNSIPYYSFGSNTKWMCKNEKFSNRILKSFYLSGLLDSNACHCLLCGAGGDV